MQDKYCVDCHNIYFVKSQYKGNHKRGGAAATFVLALIGHIVAVNAILGWRPTDDPPSGLTDMQDKYCVDCHNVYSIKSQY